MFGYITVDKPDLTFKEYDVYRSFYCGLCECLREKYGVTGQLTLSYDMTFLAMLLSSLYDAPVSKTARRCVVHPFKKQNKVSSLYTEYAADMSVLISKYQCLDNWRDEKKLSGLAMASLLSRKSQDESAIMSRDGSDKSGVCDSSPDSGDEGDADNFSRGFNTSPDVGASSEDRFYCAGGRAFIPYSEKEEAVKKALNQLNEKEDARVTDIDGMAGLFGQVAAVLFTPHRDEWEPKLKRFGFFLGKYIYILDAYDDIEKDLKKGVFNPLSDMAKKPDFKDQIFAMLKMMMSECAAVFEMLPVIDNAGIMRNIIYAGVWQADALHRERKEK